MEINEKIFKAYDVRGIYPDQLNGEIAYKIAVSYAKKIKPKQVIVGKDMRQASDEIYDQIVEGLIDQGVDVFLAGRMTNPMIGFATWFYAYDGGIIASASHNPVGYGGIKMMSKGAVSIPGEDTELKSGVIEGNFDSLGDKGSATEVNINKDYIKFLLKFVNISKLKKTKIFFDPLYGSVGLIIKDLLNELPVEPVYNNADPDQNFGGLSEPNPLNSQVRGGSVEKFKKSGAEFGVIWDGDGDRCFFLDEAGNFIDAPYITALLCEQLSKKYPKLKVVGDARIIWPIEKAVTENDGQFFSTKAGYRFLKEKMLKEGAEFGAEMTAHYFFKENHYCDNGIIPFLLVWQIISESGQKLSQLLSKYQAGHALSEEIKFQVEDPAEMIKTVKENYREFSQNELDGLTVESPEFRFNLRGSNTEPVVKLNMEAKSQEILKREKEKLLSIVK